jgi:hypothetical protein
MQGEPETLRPDPEHTARVARILDRYGAERPLGADNAPLLAQEVRQALDELTGPGAAEPEPPPAPPPRVGTGDAASGIGRWRRLVLALVAAALIVLFWKRLGWIG